jgi:SNF2 family DNA or RNA helicase
MAPHSYRKRLEECYDMPPKIYQKREVPLTDEQRRIYRELKEFATVQLSSEVHVTATMVMTQVLRLHQVLCGHVRDEQGNVHEISQNRTRELLDLLGEFDGKAVIWCSYDEDIRRVSEAIRKEYTEGGFLSDDWSHGPVARFWGGNLRTREEEERRFKTDPTCRFMVATAAAGGRGRTWDAASLVVYYSNTPNLEHREQSEERPQNVGKMNSTLYVDLVSPETVDEKYLHALRAKIDMAAAVNGDSWRDWVV